MTHSYIPQPGGPGAYEQQVAARDRAQAAEILQIRRERDSLETELGQARKRNAELQQRAETAEAALAALHKGEEPCEDERTVPTPAQWIWLWNRATPERRLAMAGLFLELQPRLNRAREVLAFYNGSNWQEAMHSALNGRADHFAADRNAIKALPPRGR